MKVSTSFGNSLLYVDQSPLFCPLTSVCGLMSNPVIFSPPPNEQPTFLLGFLNEPQRRSEHPGRIHNPLFIVLSVGAVCFEGRGAWIRVPSLGGSPEFSALLRNRDLEHVRSSTPDQQTRGTGMYAISLLYAHLFHFPPSFYPFSL